MATECPTKLYYTGKKEYGNSNLENAFLEALAGGGFQVGELAKHYFPDGTEVETLDTESALKETSELLKREKVVIYEGAFRFENLLVRADIVCKNGNCIDLYEVKAKSFDPAEENQFKKKKGGLVANWLPYLRDVAFQKYVIKNAIANCTVQAHLMLANKGATCSVEGLNQIFLLKKAKDGRKRAFIKAGTAPEHICKNVLIAVAVDDEIEMIWRGEEAGPSSNKKETSKISFADTVKLFAEKYRTDQKIVSDISEAPCKSCEFRISNEMKATGLKSGFDECWRHNLELKGILNPDMTRAKVIDLWNFRKSKDLMATGKFFLHEIREDDLSVKESEKEGMSSSERQLLQIQKACESSPVSYVDLEGLSVAFSRWNFPMHFIDFETTMVALPFHKGRRPYEQIAFQFSHHVLHADGRIEHAGEYINDTPGAFPNYDFLRALKAELEKDEGTIFRYAPHENTVLCQIYDQLEADPTVADKTELQSFIRTITNSDHSRGIWEGQRNMVDLCDTWKKFAYLPATGGSNSIKQVLPAILNEKTPSVLRFSEPIYGLTGPVKSRNFESWAWIRVDGNKIKDPYKFLPPVFDDLTELERNLLENRMTDDDLASGGAAMTAYSMMQFTEMAAEERIRVRRALLKYCELDTFAMVLLFLYFKDVLEAEGVAEKVA